MCTACKMEIDTVRRDAFGQRMMDMLNYAMTAQMVSLGHRAGLFDALADGQWQTSEALAAKTGLHERYVREWLAAMTAGAILQRNPSAGAHRLPGEHAHWLSRESAVNLAVYAQYPSALAAVEDRILECFRHGGGVDYTEYPRFHEVMAEDSDLAVVPTIVEGIVPLAAGLHERLQAGIDVLDIGCGRGGALRALAQTYPSSRFVGYDLSAEAIDYARQAARQEHLANMRFEQRDLTHWREPESFDWITAFDAIHDQAQPAAVLSAVRQALRPGGVFLMMDIDLSSEPAENVDHPLGPMLHAISVMHCMPVSLAQGGMGLGTAWGVQRAEAMLHEAGFEQIRQHRFDGDVQNVYFIMQT